MNFSFGEYKTNVYITHELPKLSDITADFNNALIIADENTREIAKKICDKTEIAFCELKSGEENKNWQSVQTILNKAHNENLGRDCIFIAVGGGVIGDIAGFAASIYKRGCRFALVSTTLLGMVDASVGGKTGFDLFEIKNLAGTFYPALSVYMPLDALSTLPKKEFKSGLAELIKTAVLAGDDLLNDVKKMSNDTSYDLLRSCIEKAVMYKGSIVSEDPKETTGKRMLLNLGHTFGHALESACGLGSITHGEAVAWGMVRACELGTKMSITPGLRAKEIKDTIASFGYNYECPHPLAANADVLINTMKSDKKKKDGKITFIVPDTISACPVTIDLENEIDTIHNILKGGFNL